MDKLPMTTEGHVVLQEELRNLKSVERPNIVKAIAAAREHGDLSENAEYHAARERQSFIEGRIGELEDAAKRAEVIDTSKLKGKTVRFGATVKVIDEETDEEITYQLVGELEADIKELCHALQFRHVVDREPTGPGIPLGLMICTNLLGHR